MAKGTSPISIFQYSDYRRFLSDWYRAMKRSRASVSFRSFAQRAGLRSINFFKLVMEGERNLTEESVSKFALGLKLNKQEREFFRNLVFYSQAKTHEQRDLYYQALLRSRKFSQLKPIERDQYEYYSAWHHPVIRELAVSKDFDGTPEWLAQRLYPSVTPAQAEKSVELLNKLGFIERDTHGRWKQANALVSTGPEIASHLVHNYHKIILDLSKEILDRIPAAEREVSTMTLGIIKERIPQLKRKIQEFRQEILKLVSVDSEPESVVQLNIQMFPLAAVAGYKTEGSAQ